MKLCKKGIHLYDTKQCMICEKAWRIANKERLAQEKKQYDLLNREQSNENRRVRRTQNPEYYRQLDKLQRMKSQPKRTAAQVRRQAAKLQRTPKWLTPLHFKQIEMFYETAAALTKEFGVQMDVDHREPLQGKDRSGLHVPWNLQVITHAENMSKGNR
jgi:hypothetical protein